MLAFLVMLVIGFTVPLFQLDNQNPASTNTAEPRLCQSDADCYLLCEQQPVAVLCSENLCIRNGCEEYSLYPYSENPITFQLKVLLRGEERELQKVQQGDLFVEFGDAAGKDGLAAGGGGEVPDAGGAESAGGTGGSKVRMFSRLPLGRLLEKAGIRLAGQCLFLQGISYCTGSAGSAGTGTGSTVNGGTGAEDTAAGSYEVLTVKLNGEEVYAPEIYIPQEGDEIVIEYGPVASG